MLGVITWSKNVKHWQYNYESYSIAFLDIENPEIDTNIVVLQYPQPEIEYMTWSMTSSRDAKMSSVESTVFKVIPLNFLTSKTYKITPKTLLYDFYSLVNKWGTLVPPIGLNRQIFYLGCSKVNDVMTSFRDVIPSCKYDNNNQVEFSHQQNYRNENEISSGALWQAELEANRFLTSCSNFSDVMTSRYDTKTSWQCIHDNCMVPSNRNIYRNKCVS